MEIQESTLNKSKKQSAATVTIRRAGEMTPRGRKDIAIWLRHVASAVIKHGPNMAKRFTASYRYRIDKAKKGRKP